MQSTWSVGRLAGILTQRFRLRRALARGRRPDPAAAAKQAARDAVWTQARAGVGHLLDVDETDVHRLPLVRAKWMKGPRVPCGCRLPA